ncbi:DUF1002 domain-containing protein [Paludifilum halophilum]|uniref:DUF1002 domain-containing protein n=1 Tax=Paludifilum halophilum TaxID=1642702 RepID=A0A235B9W3_9BACL|nr:DUF1002 domain-containing protein [Paludifilum halophilum]OYD09056.1 hypothetical protein CHM34_04615 [Paludifilum halophilum]
MSMKKWSLFALIGILLFAAVAPQGASADAVSGETVVTLGADLTPDQRESILQEMNVDSNVETINVSIADIREYLHGKKSGNAPASGDNKAYSSARITLTESGNGIQVQATNVTRVTEQMYANALLTAGVKDAQVYVTSPKPVTGTAALTGIMMAFEKASDQSISQEQREVANEEMARTSELGQKIGDQEKAADFMTQVKDEIAKKQPENKEEVREIVINVAGDLNINLNNQDTQNITNVMYKFSQLNIDWGSFGDQLNRLKEDLNKAFDTEQAQGFFDKFFAWLSDFFSSIFSTN